MIVMTKEKKSAGFYSQLHSCSIEDDLNLLL